ncbi:MAG: S9 family peptidase, partial [Planctomycetes bacterium]|nr:S9 family peptidase [Planctomycetota bacterium]
NIKEDKESVSLIKEEGAKHLPVGSDGDIFYFHTNYNAPRGEIIAVNTNKPEKHNWKIIIPQQDETISDVIFTNNKFVIVYMKDAYNIMKIYSQDGKFENDVAMPTYGSIPDITVSDDPNELYLSFESFLYPPTIYKFNLDSNKLDLFMGSAPFFDQNKFTTKQVFCQSKDGTKIPLFLTHKLGIKMDSSNPVLLYGYGGFNTSLTPYFSNQRILWLENGGVFAMAIIRGGGEYGQAWHDSGRLLNKQNSFDDFIAASEWLIDNKYTSPAKLSIWGASNGGLLVAACMTQKPDLFGAVICMVPVIDMLRYTQLGHSSFYWATEYGNGTNNEEEFNVIYSYSPLHKIKKNTTYPATYVLTAENDQRVHPAHSFKFVSALQDADSGKNPILLRYETKSGHGHGKPLNKAIEEAADVYTFIFKALDIKYKKSY